jgi:hypothetical protein
MLECFWIIVAWCVVKELKRTHVATVPEIVKQPSVAAPGIDRLEYQEISTEFDEAVFISWSLVDVKDTRLGRGIGISLEVGSPAQAFIGPAFTKGMPVGKAASVVNTKFN